MSKFVSLFLLLSPAFLLLHLAAPNSAQGLPPPAKSGRASQRGGVTPSDQDEDDGNSRGNDGGRKGTADSDAASGEKEEPGLSRKLLNVLVNHLSSHLPKISTESVVNWVQETFGLDKQTSRNYVRKAEEMKRRRGRED